MPHHVITSAALAVATLTAVACAQERNPAAATATEIRSKFARLDTNQNRRLELDEFARRPGDPDVLRRDFSLYDLDANETLSLAEFSSVSGLAEPWLRGRMADPFDDLVEQAVAALDESYDNWNERPNELVNAHTFVGNFIGSISAGGKRYVTGRVLRQADQDSDGRLSRAEAKIFLQHQLGIRWYEGPPLREPTGRLLRFDRFIDIDQNQSSSLSHQEFMRRWPDRDTAERDFSVRDRDGNGAITYAEYAHFASPNYTDPIEWFRAADTDLNARIDLAELQAATESPRLHLVSTTIAAFDDDRDDHLSLQEYRLSMHANVNYSWDARPIDFDRDGALSYDEFKFHRVDLFQLQRRFYFHRLDRDADGKLSPQEFDFRSQTPLTIYLRSVDSDDQRRLYQEREYPECGWPAISRDGRRILFHRSGPNNRKDAVIVMLTLDGSMNNLGLRELCPGMKPTWSAGGDQFACERNDRFGRSVWIANLDGHGANQIAKDGHSPCWSPDGKTIAYISDNGITILDVGTRKSNRILEREGHKYGDLGEAIAWSPDSKRIAVLATRGATTDLLIIPVDDTGDQPRFSLRRRFKTKTRSNLSWTTDGKILLSIPIPGGDRNRLVALQADNNAAPKPIPVFPETEDWKSASTTPDGKWYIAVSGQ